MITLNMYVATILGLWLLTHFGDALVHSATQLSRFFKVSDVFIGVVIIGLGTSLPEIITALLAATGGAAGLAVGNVVGSNIANILLILGLALFLFHKTPLGFVKAKADYGMMLVATFALASLSFLGVVEFWHGIILLTMLALVFYKLMHQGRKGFNLDPEDLTPHGPIGLVALQTGVALVGLWLGADLLVSGASAIAITFGVPEAVVGLSLVAVGTSLPELAATLAAYKVRNGGMILGNIIGSNMLNIFAGLGVASIFAPLPLAGFGLSISVMVVVALLLSPLFIKATWANRWIGVLFLVVYAVYIAYIYTTAPATGVVGM